jgi:hypothetical protein
MNVHYVDADNYIMAEYAWIKMYFFMYINCVSAYKEQTAFLPLHQIYEETFAVKYSKAEIPQFYYSSPLC